jgi:threonyl-tRNA synthetase
MKRSVDSSKRRPRLRPPQLEKHDHRRLGRELDLFSIHEEVGPGLILWHPRGAMVRKLLEDHWRSEHLSHGYQLVASPHIGRAALWEASGHLDYFQQGMFAPMEIDGDRYYAKPMNCPFHVMIYKSRKRSYRELPLRLGELGTVYRYERSGVLHGLLRARGFTQDDSHIFCSAEQVEEEIVKAIAFARSMLESLGFVQFQAFVATRPSKAVGSDQMWQKATASLEEACRSAQLDYAIDEGGGAFYGPKVDIKVTDALGRAWQCSTVQFDFTLPERFDVTYVAEDNRPRRPFMVHRALFGSLERFFGVLVEHYAGAFPLWLAPVQVAVLPVTERARHHAMEVASLLGQGNIRVEVDASAESLGHKVRQATLLKIPYVLVVGDREVESGQVAPRRRGGEVVAPMSVSAFLDLLAGEMAVELGRTVPS